MAPFAIIDQFGKTIAYLIYLAIGIGFGATLEMAGFADSRRLAGQFYFRNLTVLKVMFTAIVTAMVLVFLTSALGWLDYPRVYVNPTYLVPGIVGGLVMGLGFIVGGFCPGTSLVALSTLKIDAVFFFIGVSAGVFAFGESVGQFTEFFHSSSMGRFTLPQWLGAPTGAVVVGVVAMALFMFWGGEKLERRYGGPEEYAAVRVLPARAHHIASAVLLGLALVVLAIGQPTAEDRWERTGAATHALLGERGAFIQPGELLNLSQNRQVRLLILDVRSEAEYNVFHLEDARRVEMTEVEAGILGLELLSAPSNTVTVLVSNDEVRATEAWRRLKADRVLNTYVLEAGVNGWVDLFRPDLAADGAGAAPHHSCSELASLDPEFPLDPPGGEGPAMSDAGRCPHRIGTMRHIFPAALGASQPGASLDALSHEHPGLAFERKVELETKKKLGGGCG